MERQRAINEFVQALLQAGTLAAANVVPFTEAVALELEQADVAVAVSLSGDIPEPALVASEDGNLVLYHLTGGNLTRVRYGKLSGVEVRETFGLNAEGDSYKPELMLFTHPRVSWSVETRLLDEETRAGLRRTFAAWANIDLR